MWKYEFLKENISLNFFKIIGISNYFLVMVFIFVYLYCFVKEVNFE